MTFKYSIINVYCITRFRQCVCNHQRPLPLPLPAIDVEPKWPPVKEPTMPQIQPWPPHSREWVEPSPPTKKSCNRGAECFLGNDTICGMDGFCKSITWSGFGYLPILLHF